MNTTFTKTISIRDVYGTDTPEIPKGYKAVDFRLPSKGEAYLSASAYWLTACEDHARTITSIPHLILSKLPDPVVVKGNVENTIKTTVEALYRSDVSLPEGYEFVDFRAPKAQEKYLGLYGHDVISSNYDMNGEDISYSRIIVRKVTLLGDSKLRD